MKKKKFDNKIILIISIIVLVLFLCFIKLGIYLIENQEEIAHKRAQKEYGYQTMGTSQNPQYSEIAEEKTISYKNISLLQSLNGSLPASTVTKKIKDVFANNIPDVIEKTKGKSNDDLKEYFKKNQEEIRNNLRIDDEDSFVNMVNTFSKLKSNLKTDYKSCEFLKKDDLVFVFTYENGENVECTIIGQNANTILFGF